MSPERIGRGAAAAALALAAITLSAASARATLFYRDVEISGNLEIQEILRLPAIDDWSFVQQRNTFRLEYEHKLVKRGVLLDRFSLPFVESAKLLAYYRFVYDSIYDLAPGGFLRAQDGSIGGKIGDLPRRARKDVAFENVLREVYLDLALADLPVTIRVGRYQVVWGNTLVFRVLDNVNALDLTWHLAQEVGLLGRVGFTEQRIPAWTIGTSIQLGSLGPLGDLSLQVFEIPFDFQPTELRFFPAPWSVPIRDPFRAGLVADAGEEGFGLPGLVFVQPCFDTTGTTRSNEEARPDFSASAQTGFCDAAGLRRSRLRQGLYHRRDPASVHQVGAQLSGLAPAGVGFTLNYLYRRSLVDTGAALVKVQTGALTSRPQDFLEIAPHETTDPITRKTSSVAGFVRVPIEFYYPYVHNFGASLDYFDDWTQAVWNAEVRWTRDQPMPANTANGIRRTELVTAALNFDRPTWIRWLNPRATWLVVGQVNAIWLPEVSELTRGDPPPAIPGQLRDSTATDRPRELELATLLVLQSFYANGVVAPLVAWFSDWGNGPSMLFLFLLRYKWSPHVLIEPGLTIVYTGGRVVDDPWGVGSLSRHDELQLKVTYQF